MTDPDLRTLAQELEAEGCDLHLKLLWLTCKTGRAIPMPQALEICRQASEIADLGDDTPLHDDYSEEYRDPTWETPE